MDPLAAGVEAQVGQVAAMNGRTICHAGQPKVKHDVQRGGFEGPKDIHSEAGTKQGWQ